MYDTHLYRFISSWEDGLVSDFKNAPIGLCFHLKSCLGTLRYCPVYKFSLGLALDLALGLLRCACSSDKPFTRSEFIAKTIKLSCLDSQYLLVR